MDSTSLLLPFPLGLPVLLMMTENSPILWSHNGDLKSNLPFASVSSKREDAYWLISCARLNYLNTLFVILWERF